MAFGAAPPETKPAAGSDHAGRRTDEEPASPSDTEASVSDPTEEPASGNPAANSNGDSPRDEALTDPASSESSEEDGTRTDPVERPSKRVRVASAPPGHDPPTTQRKYRAMVAGGSILVAAGILVAVSVVPTGVVMRRNATDDEKYTLADWAKENAQSRRAGSTALLVVGSVLPTLMLGGGIALVTLGVRGKREGRERAVRTVRVSPSLRGGVGGITASGRF